MGSQSGKLLDVDLSSGNVSERVIDDKILRDYVGGSGLAAKKALEKIGIDAGRLRHEYVSAAEGARYAEKVDDFTDFLADLGPLEMGDDLERRLREVKLGSVAKRGGSAYTSECPETQQPRLSDQG